MRALLLLPFLLIACDRRPPAPEPRERSGPVSARSAPEPAQAARRPSSKSGNGEARDAAAALRRYYGLVEQGDYAGAWNMRTAADGIDRERFAANFKAYESYRAQVGEPSLPVRSGGFDYVEVPVMITGRIRGGRPFSNGGSVTLRRAHDGPDRAWRIYTG